MTYEELLTPAKQWLRITSDVYDDEIIQTMQACEPDLKNSGIVEVDLADPLIQQAIKLYLKSQFGYNDTDSRFSEAYEYLKASLALSSDYNTTASGGDAGEG